MPGGQNPPATNPSKLAPAASRGRMLPRERLRLPEAFRDGSRRLALICAPAGYGKTSLMGCWFETMARDGLHCAWLSLDPEDNDPARFMHHLISALQRSQPALGKAALKELAADYATGWKPALESLAADLGGLRRPMALFIDDLHLLEEPDVLWVVDWLLNYAPAFCRFALGTREARRLRLGRQRAHAQVVELGMDDLRFSSDDVQRFLELRLGQAVQRDDAGALSAKTEGWPAALELAAAALRSGAARSEVIDRFSGRERNVVDYLAEVVLERMDPRMRRFALRIAQFDRVCAELARAVSGEEDADALLQGFHQANLLLVPLDGEARWYRFHHLAADFLRSRHVRELGAPAEVILRGARWLYQHGHAEAAINAAIRAQAWDVAAGWMAESVESLVYRLGYHHTLLQWMKRVPDEYVDRHPDIRIHYAFALAFSPFQNEVMGQVHRLDQLRRRLSGEADADPGLAERIECELEVQHILLKGLKDDGAAAFAEAQAWMRRWPGAPLLRRGTVGNVLAFGFKTLGEIDQGLAMTVQVREWLYRVEGWYSLAWTEFLTALLYLKRGDLHAARDAAQAGLSHLQLRLDGHPAQAAMLHSVLAMTAYEFDELDAARAHLDICLPRLEAAGTADPLIIAYVVAAKLDRLDRGERAGLDRLRHGQAVGARRRLERVSISLAAEECGWHSRAGNVEDARRVAQRYGFGELPVNAAGSGLTAEKAAMVSTRYRLRQAPESVIAPLDQAIARCLDKGIFRRLTELLLLKAVALWHAGDGAHAQTILIQALTVAAPRHYVRVFVDEAVDLLPLFERVDFASLRGSEAAPLARQLLRMMRERAAESATAGAGAADMPVPVETLSKRERAILKRLESDLSNKEIAEAIFISEGTLKWHLHNIYGKLAVRSRSGAVQKARTLALL